MVEIHKLFKPFKIYLYTHTKIKSPTKEKENSKNITEQTPIQT